MSHLLFTGDCPVEEGEALVYDMEIPIENFYPTIEILGRLSSYTSLSHIHHEVFKPRWKLQDENGDDFICFEIPMKIEA